MIEDHTALYSPLDIAYAKVMSGPYRDLSQQTQDGQIVAAEKNGRITGYWRPVVADGSDDWLKYQAQRLLDQHQDITYLDFCVHGCISPITKELLKAGYVAAPHLYHVVDLFQTQEVLWRDVQKSYKPLISRDINRVGICKNSAQWSQYMRLHASLARRSTRCKESWEIQWRMHECNQAFSTLLYSEDGHDLLAGAMFMHNRNHAYYASGKSVEQTNSHALIWKGIELAKQMGIRWFCLGEQVFSGDPKAIGISAFKRRFGGQTRVALLIRTRP